MKKLLFILTGLFFLGNFAAAGPGISLSEKSKPKDKKVAGFDKTRLLIGPGIGAGAGYRAFSINLAPSVAYAFHENFNAGATLGFNYFQQSEDYNNYLTNMPETYKHKYPGYSFSVFARYLLKNFLLFNFEPELNNVKYETISLDYNTGKLIGHPQRLTIPSVLVGIGYAQRFGDYSYSFISLNYDLVQNPNARYYQTLDYRFGVMIQLFN